VQVCDPEADAHEAVEEYGVQLTPLDQLQPSEAVVVAVAHKEFLKFDAKDYLRILKQNPVIIDVKGICDQKSIGAAGIRLWRL
jgi:UDP-N-acetyl-D-galactosamine dehydrogenase